MKNPLEIPLYLIQRGSARAITALGLDGETPALEFLTKLANENPKGHQILLGQIKFISEAPQVRNHLLLKCLDASRQLYEFHPRTGLRLYCFFDGNDLVIVTNGGKKGKKKEQNGDISRAKQRQDDYLALKRKGAEIKVIT